MSQVVGVGAGGHARVVIDVLRTMGRYEIAALVDSDPNLRHQEVMGIPVVGGDDRLPELLENGVEHAFIGVGSVGDAGPRRRLFRKLHALGFRVVRAVHASAIVADSVELGKGITVMAGVIVNANVSIADNVILNTGVIIEHDCIIGSHTHVATGAQLAGGVEVGEGSHVGLGASVRECVKVGAGSIVGAGAVVVEDVPPNVIVTGVPAGVVREIPE